MSILCVTKNISYDKIIIGAGFYGLYAALKCGQQGQKILVLEADTPDSSSAVTCSKPDMPSDMSVTSAPFSRATYINQARVHMGYHYPRSFSTAIKSAHYFKRFYNDFAFCCLTEFDQVYATSSHFSWTNAQEFRDFCRAADIRCDDISPDKYFNKGLCDGAFITTEYTYDAQILKSWFLEKLRELPNVEIKYGIHVSEETMSITKTKNMWQINTKERVERVKNKMGGGVRNSIHSKRNLCRN